MQIKNIAQLSIGDIVLQHGGRFQVIAAPRESRSHFPLSAHLTRAAGPSNCAVVDTVCISGEVPGYFQPGKAWGLQGTVGGLFAVNFAVEA